MADLGNLYFGLHIKDYTKSELAAIEKRLSSLDVAVKLGLDTKELEKKLKSAMEKVVGKDYKIKVGVDEGALSKALSSLKAFDSATAANTGAVKRSTEAAMLKAQADIRMKEALNKAKIATQEARTEAIRQASALRSAAAARAEDAAASAREAEQGKKVSKEMSNTIQVADRLKTVLATVFSGYMAQRFIKNLIEIGGQFQTQHIALKSMLGDAAKADDIFSRMKGLAVESPFTFMDLASYTKQLEAFSIPYDELYDTTKRLADISAGLGVDMYRLILAFGQVRAASYLRGQEIRQFTEAGIPLLEALAKRFTQLNGVVMTTGQVFDMVSKRQVPFEMVRDVLWEMTDEGGQFYNMQAELVESLSGKYQKLRDSIQIMMSGIADANNSVLGGTLDKLTEMTTKWESYVPAIYSAVVAFGVYKASMIAVNVATRAWGVVTSEAAVQVALANKAGIALTRTQGLLRGAMVAVQKSALSLKAALAGLGTGGWIAVVVAGLAAIGTYIYKAYQNATKLQRELKEIDDELRVQNNGAGMGYKKLVDDLGRAREGTKGYADVIKQINTSYGDYLDHLFDESTAYEEVAASVDKVVESLRRKNAEQAAQKKITVIEESYGNALKQTENEMTKYLAKTNDLTKADAERITDAYKQFISYGQSAEEALENIKKVYQEYSGVDFGRTFTIMADGEALTGSYLMDAAKNYKALYDSMLKEVKAVYDASSDVVTFAIKEIEEEYEKRKKNAALEEQERLNFERLHEILAKLKDLGVPEGSTVYIQYASELEQLKLETQDWVKEIKAIPNITANLMPDFKNAETSMSYLQKLIRLYDTYKKDLLAYSRTEGIVSEIDKKEIETRRTNMQAIEAVFKVMGEDIENFSRIEEKEAEVGDEIADGWKRRLDLMKQAMDAYKKYEEVYGREGANEKLNESGDYEELGSNLDFSKIVEMLEEFTKQINAMAATEAQKDVAATARRTMADIEFKTDKESLERSLSQAKEQMEKAISKWDLFEKIFAVTGDFTQSYATAFSDIQVWDEASMRLREALEQGMEKANIEIPDDLFTAMEEKIEEIFGENGELFSLWRAVRDRINKNGINFIDKSLAGMRGSQSLQKQIEVVYANRAASLGSLAASGVEEGSPMYKAVAAEFDRQITEMQIKLFETSQEFQDLFTGAMDTSILATARLQKEAAALLEQVREGAPVYDANGNVVGHEITTHDREGNETKSVVDTKQAQQLEQIVDRMSVPLISGFRKMKSDIDAMRNATDDMKKNIKDVFSDAIASFQEVCGQAASATGAIGDVFAAFGNDSAAAKAQAAGGIISGMSDLASMNPAQMVQGLSSIITSIVMLHDTKLQNQIEASEREVKKLQNAYKNLEWEIEHQLGSATQEQTKKMMEDLEKQEAELEKQYRLEEEKSNTDKDKLIDLEQEIEEAKQEIAEFYEDLADEQFSINLKDWASDIADSLVDAFASGESAAKAFESTVADIMNDVISDILQLNVIEPAMQSLENLLFGDNGIATNNSAGGTDITAEEMLRMTQELLALEDSIGEAKDLYDAMTQALKNEGISLSGTSSGLSASIAGVTEDTADLLASYINAIRADVSVERIAMESIDAATTTMSVLMQTQISQMNTMIALTERVADATEGTQSILKNVATGIQRLSIQ